MTETIDLIETITWKDQIIAMIIRAGYDVEGIKFLSPNDFSLQLGHMRRPAGYQVVPHTHNPEVLFLKKGVIRIDFYSLDQEFVESRELHAGDIILLAGAGHGIDVIEEAVLVEVKNGPYIEGADKGRFPGRKST
jgi:hypothetical protein